jgi:hypothetical protein
MKLAPYVQYIFFQKCNVVDEFIKLVCGTITVVFRMYLYRRWIA